MPSFRKWVEYEVKKRWSGKYSLKGPDPATIYATYDAIRDKAEQRGRDALIQGMGAEKLYQLSPEVHHAVDVIAQAVVAGVFGEIPLTAEEKNTKLDLFQTLLNESAPPTTFTDIEAKAQHAASLTMEQLMGALEKLKQGSAAEKHIVHPVQLGQIGVYGPVTMGTQKAPKSGLPAAQDAVKAEEAALSQLLARVEKKSDELLGIKQKAKYEELAGIDPEEI